MPGFQKISPNGPLRCASHLAACSLESKSLERNGPDAILQSWTNHSSFANGRLLKVHDGVRTIQGVTRGLNPLGALRVETETGRIEEIYSGDVISWT
jgi:biotin-(acetyl-CoA carboxylase) ligase